MCNRSPDVLIVICAQRVCSEKIKDTTKAEGLHKKITTTRMSTKRATPSLAIGEDNRPIEIVRVSMGCAAWRELQIA